MILLTLLLSSARTSKSVFEPGCLALNIKILALDFLIWSLVISAWPLATPFKPGLSTSVTLFSKNFDSLYRSRWCTVSATFSPRVLTYFDIVSSSATGIDLLDPSEKYTQPSSPFFAQSLCLKKFIVAVVSLVNEGRSFFPIKAFKKVDFPALNSPTTTIVNSPVSRSSFCFCKAFFLSEYPNSSINAIASSRQSVIFCLFSTYCCL